MKLTHPIRTLLFASAFSCVGLNMQAADSAAPRPAQNTQAAVSVLGAIKYPGRFAVAADSTLARILELAGGVTADGTGPVRVTRRIGGQKTQTFNLTPAKDGAFRLMPQDVVYVVRSR